MRARPNSLILCDRRELRIWSPAREAFVSLSVDAAHALCTLQLDPSHPMDEGTESQLAALGLLVADEAHFDYPERRLRARPVEPQAKAAGPLPEDLALSSRTLLRFTSDAIYAWAPDAPVDQFEQRYDHQLLLDRDACAVLLSFVSPADQGPLTRDMPEETRSAYAAALTSAGILAAPEPPITQRSSRPSIEVRIPELEGAASPPLSKGSASPSESFVDQIGRGAASLFFFAVFSFLIFPLGMMLRLSPESRRRRARHQHSTWEPCRTEGLRDPSRYRLPY